MSDADHTRLLAALRRQGLDERALIDAMLDTCPARLTVPEQQGFLLRTAQAVLDRLLVLACEGPACECGHPLAWHASFAPRATTMDDGPVLGRCSPPANRVRLTKAGGLAVERGSLAAGFAARAENATSGAERARAVLRASAAARDAAGCACRAYVPKDVPDPKAADDPHERAFAEEARAAFPVADPRADGRCVTCTPAQACALHARFQSARGVQLVPRGTCPACGALEPHRVGVAASGRWAGHEAFICPSCDHRWRSRVAPS